MIGGHLVVDNRRVVTLDLERLRRRVAAAHDRLLAANVDNRRLYEALEPVVGSYCPGLARAPTTSTATAPGSSNTSTENRRHCERSEAISTRWPRRLTPNSEGVGFPMNAVAVPRNEDSPLPTGRGASSHL